MFTYNQYRKKNKQYFSPPYPKDDPAWGFAVELSYFGFLMLTWHFAVRADCCCKHWRSAPQTEIAARFGFETHLLKAFVKITLELQWWDLKSNTKKEEEKK